MRGVLKEDEGECRNGLMLDQNGNFSPRNTFFIPLNLRLRLPYDTNFLDEYPVTEQIHAKIVRPPCVLCSNNVMVARLNWVGLANNINRMTALPDTPSQVNM